MVTKVEKIAFIVLGIIVVLGFVFWKDARTLMSRNSIALQEKPQKEKKKKDKTAGNKEEQANTQGISIRKKWELPSSLKEISGIAFIDNNRIACVQDEEGTIYIFNRTNGKVEKEIPFGKAGDYEGIAIVGTTAYVQRADGKIFEVADYNSGKPSVTEHSTPLTAKQNVEGLGYDKKNNRLLLAIKGKEPASDEYKGIYAFDLSSKKMATEPVVKIDLTHDIWKDISKKNKIQPSDLEVHPSTGDLYIVDGADPKLLVMDERGNKKNLYQLSDNDFMQPEGIAFSEAGELFISNEGRTGSGNILEVSIDTMP